MREEFLERKVDILMDELQKLDETLRKELG